MYSFFISSTFKDMHYERDIINRRITPKINFRLQEYNQSVRVIDLRWGIDTSAMTEQDASEKVLSVCYNAIDTCKPFFIVLIGDRYGYVPQGSNISITHMEIIRGIIENADKSHIYIYMREADYSGVPENYLQDYFDSNETDRNRLKELKETLKQNFKTKCRTYSAKWSEEKQCLVSDEFEDMIRADLESDLIAMNNGVRFYSELHKQIYENEIVLKESLIDAYQNKTKIDSDLKNIVTTDSPFILLGTNGIGKSIYLSLLCDKLKAMGEEAQIIYCVKSVFSCSTHNIAEFFLYALKTATKRNYDFESGALLSYEDIVSDMLSLKDRLNKKIYLFIDAIENCDNGIQSFIDWCDCFFAGKFKIVYSASFESDENEGSQNPSVSVLKYDCNDYKSMIETTLKKHNKSISEELIDLMSKKIQSPLQLNILLSRLLNLSASDYETIRQQGGGAEAINAYLKQIINNSPDNIGSAIGTYVEDFLKSGVRREFVMLLLHILSVCPFGISEDDIRAILKDQIDWVEIDYLNFLESLSLIVHVNGNGDIYIAHNIVKDAVCTLFSDMEENICRLVAEYFINFHKLSVFSVRTIFAVTIRANLKKELFTFLTSNLDLFTSRDRNDSLIADDIRNIILNLFFVDKGAFLFSLFTEHCENIVDFVKFQSVIASSLLSVPYFVDEKISLDLVYAVMTLPKNYNFEIKSYMDQCVRFLKGHHVSQVIIEEFIKYFDQKEDPIDEKLKLLNSQDELESLSVFGFLLEKAKELTANKDTVPQAEKILDNLFAVLQKGYSGLIDEQHCFLKRRIYSIYAMAYKTIGDYDRALCNDEKALEVSKKMYQTTNSYTNCLQYRTQLYNVANIIEAQAISKGDDLKLWARVEELFSEVCKIDSVLVSQKFYNNTVLENAYDLFSWGNAGLRVGKTKDGAMRCKEGIMMIERFRQDNWPILLYSKICVSTIQPLLNICAFGEIDTAKEIEPIVLNYLKKVMDSKDNDAIKQMYRSLSKIFDSCNNIIYPLQKRGDSDSLIFTYKLLVDFIKELLPIADYGICSKMLIAKYELASILFSVKNDYQGAFKELAELMHLIEDKKLAVPDKQFEINKKMCKSLIHGYALYIICADILGKKETIERCIEYSEEYAKFFSICLTCSSNDYPMVLFHMAMKIISCRYKVGAKEILKKAQKAINDGNYDGDNYIEVKDEIAKFLAVL